MKIRLFLLINFFLVQNAVYSQCWDTIAGGGYSSYAIKSDGSLWAWGYNYYGQLGDNTNIDRSVLTPIGNATNWATITTNPLGGHTVGMKTDGTLWIWGNNFYGQFGNNTETDSNHPINVGIGSIWQTAISGGNYTLAIKQDGTLWGWGYNGDGELGNNSQYTSEPNMIQIGADNNWKSVSPGFSHSMAIKNDNTLWCWGDGYSGALGNGMFFSNVNVPVQLDNSVWALVKGGYHYSMGIKQDGTLWAWGINDKGQLGDGTTINKSVPVQIGTSHDWVKISAGYQNSLAIKQDGTLWTWGFNDKGQLGDGTTVDKIVPTQIGMDSFWTDAKCGREHTLALNSDNMLWGWGGSSMGELANGIHYTPTTTPVYIDCTPLLLSLGQTSEDLFSVFPNPAKDRLFIQNENNLSIEKITIHEMTGKKIMEQIGYNTEINISEISEGLYIIQIYSEKGIFQKKLIKQ